MTRFLHTADWQLGTHLSFLGAAARRARAIRMETVDRIVSLALSEAVEFVVVAGDVFDSPDVSDGLLRELFERLAPLDRVPMFLLPGNHDPASAGGIWERSTWKEGPPCVRPLLSESEVEVGPGIRLYPCPIRQKSSRQDPMQWVPAREVGDRAVRIALAHGALDCLPRQGNFPISTSRAERHGLDFVALGDWHTPMRTGNMAYAGAPEPCSFGERDSGYAQIVEIEHAGAEPSIDQRRVAGLVWQKAKSRIDDFDDLARLVARLHSDRSELVLDLSVQIGSPEMRVACERLLDELAEQTFFLRQDVDVVHLEPLDYGALALAAELDADLLRAVSGGEGGLPESVPRMLQEAELDVLREARRQLAVFARNALEGEST